MELFVSVTPKQYNSLVYKTHIVLFIHYITRQSKDCLVHTTISVGHFVPTKLKIIQIYIFKYSLEPF